MIKSQSGYYQHQDYSKTYNKEVFLAAMLGMSETKLTDNATLYITGNPEWTTMALEKNKLCSTPDILSEMMKQGTKTGSERPSWRLTVTLWTPTPNRWHWQRR